MKLSTMLFLFLFVSNIVGMYRDKIPKGGRGRGFLQRGNEQKEQQKNITDTSEADIGQSNPEIEAHSNILRSQEEIPVVASGSSQRKTVKRLPKADKLQSKYYNVK